MSRTESVADQVLDLAREALDPRAILEQLGTSWTATDLERVVSQRCVAATDRALSLSIGGQPTAEQHAAQIAALLACSIMTAACGAGRCAALAVGQMLRDGAPSELTVH